MLAIENVAGIQDRDKKSAVVPFNVVVQYLNILQATWTKSSPFMPLSLFLSQAIIQPQAHTWKALAHRLEVGSIMARHRARSCIQTQYKYV